MLVEVSNLCVEDGALQWKPILNGLVPLSVYYTQVLILPVTVAGGIYIL